MSTTSNRRTFLRQVSRIGAAAAATTALPRLCRGQQDGKLPKVAAVITEFTYRSHAHVILENFLQPYLFNGQWTDPGFQVASLYVDQFPPGEMARDVAREYKIPIYPTIPEALTLGGGKLAVDAVLSIGEHGKYPVNAKGQMEYPRKRFFDQIAAVIRAGGRPVPVFNDKHLSYRWDWAKEMYDTAQALRIPLMAGSSVPLAQRRPPLELPPEAEIEDAVSIHGGGVESYDFHALEVLQSMVEARKGGEAGAAKVQFLEGDALWKAAADGLWSVPLATAAMTAELGPDHQLTRCLAAGGKTSTGTAVPMHGIRVWYRDGFGATVLTVDSSSTRWNFACRLKGEDKPLSTSYYVGPWQNRNLFKALSHAIQTHFRQGRAPYPVERTLLVSGILDVAMDSRASGSKVVETPQLAVAYKPRDFRSLREFGDTWKIITEDMPEPKGIERVGSKS
ncbi:MAG: hypothetical protein HYX69_04140 [Planctomycetia bacterium]|nr:hypothetical protein [Planctomycetia bacterium]